MKIHKADCECICLDPQYATALACFCCSGTGEREALKELVYDTVCIGLPQDSVIVGDNLLSPARKKLLEENIGTYIDEAEEKFIALFNRYAAEREREARIEEVTRIRKRVGGSTVATNEYRAWLDERIAALKETTNE